MILGIGTDLCDMRRLEKAIARNGDRFLERCFTEHERAYAERYRGASRLGVYAKRWAAKEALVKALGTGFSDGIRLTDIEISQKESGRPIINLRGRAGEKIAELAGSRGVPDIQVTLADELPYALAYVIIQSLPQAV